MFSSDADHVVAASCRASLLHVVPPLSALISCLLSAIHYPNKGEHVPKRNRKHPIYDWTNLYLWTAIPYYNKKVCKHTYTHTWKVVWVNPMFKRQAVTAEKWTVNYKKHFFYCSLQQHLISPLTWIIRIHLRRVNTIYTQKFIYIGKAWEGTQKA